MNAGAPANVFPLDHRDAVSLRRRAFGHPGAILWLTGLSGSGKSTIAREVERRLLARGVHAFLLDGDNLRTGLSAGLGFSPEDRAEHNRRAGEAAALLADAGVVVLCALISPYAADRARVRAIRPGSFREVFVDTPLAECEARDPKGLYARARRGEIRDFTGVSAPFEPPASPDLRLATTGRDATDCADEVEAWLDRTVLAARAA